MLKLKFKLTCKSYGCAMEFESSHQILRKTIVTYPHHP